MKNRNRIISAFLLMILVLSTVLTACKSSGSSPSTTTTELYEEDLSIVSWTSHSYIKNRGDQSSSVTSDRYSLYMLKYETEGFQISLNHKEGMQGLTFAMSNGNNDSITCNIYEEMTVAIGSRDFPDPVVPYTEGTAFDLEPDTTLTFLIEFTTTAETPAGDYPYTFVVRNSEGKLVKKYTVNVHVYDITLPEDQAYTATANINNNNIKYLFGYTITRLYSSFYDMLLDHKISAYELPYDILSDEADAYMSNPRITAFRVSHKLDDETLKAVYTKLKTTPEWLEKAFIYPVDEPDTVAELQEFATACERIKLLCPDLKIVCPYYTNINYDSETDQTEFMSQYCDIMCPKLCMWDDAKAYEKTSSTLAAKYGSYSARIKAFQEAGKTVWSYVCNAPKQLYLNVFTNGDGIDHRVLFWQQYQKGSDGFLYYSTNAWNYSTLTPWDDPKTGPDKTVYGDGCLFYNGNKVGISGPVASLRLKIIRDGIEDIELFTLASEVLGENWVQAQIAKATPNLTKISVTEDEFAALRIEMCNAIEAALADKN